jgi:uncharacterized NAD(P)/FAD-binding protein YdhS
MRVAIAGLGPKGLFALERLLDHAHRGDMPGTLDIDVFEPHPVAGAGAVYDPGQPAYLRMNFAAEHLDMWHPHTRAVPAGERLGFVDWWRAHSADGSRPDRYPPRADVGTYLADGLARMCRHAPPGVRITLRRSAVHAARRTGSTWTVTTAEGRPRDYDELLVAVGHPQAGDGWRAWTHAAPLVPAVFPVTSRLSRTLVPPGCTVGVRGFALTFLDAAIALTEGRGGAFESDDHHPQRLRYVPSSGDAGRIVPFSRTGRPMLAKPDPQLAAGIPVLESIADAGSARIVALADPIDVRRDLLAILSSVAADSLLAANRLGRDGAPQRRTLRAAANWLAGACDGAAPPTGLSPAAELERSLAVGAGLHPPDLQWALGHTWRSLYPALVARLGADGLPDDQWPAFRRLAGQMERVAFGPPAVNAAKLLALVAAGRVDLTHATGGEIVTAGERTTIRSRHGEQAVDVVVDAVLPQPGASHAGGLVEQLLADGEIRIRAGRRGLEVTPDASCVGSDGERTPGLAVLGRATEDCVIGNDTLSRSLHPHADRWAQRVIRRSAQPAAADVREASAVPVA